MMQLNWGGKIILGLLGMLVGGPVGLGVGVLIGHMLDKGAAQVQNVRPQQAEVQKALFDTVFSIMGHLAKADGRVSEDEIAQARAVMDRMQLNEEQRREAIALFNRGKEADFPLDATVADFANTVKHRKQLILVLLEILLQVALADGQILLLFPEGSRGEAEELQPLRKGIYHLARSHAGTQVVPIAMHGLGRALPKGGSMIVPFNADVAIGEALSAEQECAPFMDQLQASLESLLAACITRRDARWED